MKYGLPFSLLLLWFYFPAVLAQPSGSGVIEGRVTEAASNKPVPFANVVVYGTASGTLTGEDGHYILKGLAPGYVRVAATCIGYDPYISEEIYLTNAKKITADIPLQEGQVTLEEVTVKASPFRRQEESPVSLRRIEISEIEKSPGGNRDISRVIQSFPGVGSGVAFRNDVIVRGGGPAENRFYLDGVEIPNLNHFATQGASGGPVGIINVDFIRGVDFYSGAFPANRGNSLSSVLEFRQIDGNSEKLKFRASVGASDLALTLDGPAGKNTTFIASARRSYLKFLFSALKLPFLPTYNDFQYKIKTRLNPKNELSLIGLGAYDQSSLNLKANSTPSQRYILGYLPVNVQWNYTFGLVYKHFREHGYTTLVLSRNYLNNQAYKYRGNIPMLGKTYDYLSTEAENRARVEYSGHTAGGIRIMAGAGLDFAEYANDTRNEVFLNDTLRDMQYNSRLSMFNYGLFVQASRAFYSDKLTLSAGARVDGSTFSTAMNDPLKQFSPRISFSYALSGSWFLNANAGVYYQRPPYTMLGYRNGAGQLVNRENGVRYIRADHWVGGLEYRSGQDYQVTLEAFYKRYNHYPFSLGDSISLASKGDDFGVYGAEAVRSIGRGRAYGFEILGRFRKPGRYNAIVSYTYVVSKSLNSEAGLSLLPPEVSTSWDNRHILNLTVTRKFDRHWSGGFKWRLVGGAPFTPYDYNKSEIKAAWDARGMAYPDYSLFNTRRLRAFHQLDIRIDKQYFFSKWSLNFYLDVQNCYNFKSDQPDMLVRASTVAGHPVDGDPFTDAGGIEKYRMSYIPSDGQGTILPTVGIIAEF
jgi:hypothetical protein